MCSVHLDDSSIKMPGLRAVNIIYAFYSLTIIVHGSSLYTEYAMESPKICHLYSSKQTIKLPDAEDAAVIVRPSHMFDPWTTSVDKFCKYVFKTSRHTGLFAVIQNMSFRRNGNECLDWVQFKEDGRKSPWFCGVLDHRDMAHQSLPEADDSIELSNSLRWNSSRLEFKSPKGELETRIFISKEKLLPGETLDLSIVYTPYKDCDKVKDTTKYRMNSSNYCIWEKYYCDGYRNCPIDTCRDEVGCEIVSNGTGTKVTVGAVTTLILSFLLFVMCLWTCRKHKKLCWSPDCAGPNAGATNAQPINLRTRDSSSRSVVPTAPMLDEASSRPVHDKDLPPSYDSLFPEPSIPAAT
ncbi:uncharacterized protein LOC105693513 [Athalia rosae]|uniref:uncharacterized protein LOC105693513 n=1 Tax=Athalia rosae TaxID=37344 RepID=UPI00203484AE|nr:uncharacterized protein LOC105693513 [Athalia rosae]